MSAIARIAQLHRELAEAYERFGRGQEHSAVYFIIAGDGAYVKIGRALCPDARRNELQSGNHLRLRILKTVPGGQSVEAAAHAAFSELRIRGEWFSLEPPLTTFLEELSAVEREALA